MLYCEMFIVSHALGTCQLKRYRYRAAIPSRLSEDPFTQSLLSGLPGYRQRVLTRHLHACNS